MSVKKAFKCLTKADRMEACLFVDINLHDLTKWRCQRLSHIASFLVIQTRIA